MSSDKNIKIQELTEELKNSYLSYAMSVIVARALPDVRDGLKPVQRRILWAMWENGVTSGAKFRKSAKIGGDTMGTYHPHGNLAIYDAMVRMAQEFSLRYPLIQGQGNFGCFTKDTKVKLTDGRNLSFEDLIKEHQQEKRNYTYTVNASGLILISEIKNPRLTKEKAEIIKVILDNGEEIKCTLGHLFMLRDGSYREACNLKSGDSLMPLYEKLSEETDHFNREGYLLIHQNKNHEWTPAHHLADDFNLNNGNYRKSDGKVRHHLDFNKLNNNPDNIRRVSWGEHWRIHYEQASNLHKNEEYRKKIAKGRERFWSDSNNRNQYSKRISERNFKNWQNPQYREKMREFLSVMNKEYIKRHPEKRIEFSKRATQTLKKLWQNPIYKQLFHEKIVAANKKRITNGTGRVKFLRICRETLKENKTLNQKSYEEKRKSIYANSRATSWETGLKKYYDNSESVLLNVLSQNHKVSKIEFLNRDEDVYDLTIEESHNFALAAGIFVHNSIDGDPAAADRYTEARMSKIGEELLTDIDKETVDWIPNYDATRVEPKVLPSKLPSLLLNGAVGIAVGMATNIPPHNLSEVCDATAILLDNPDATVDDLLKVFTGPDFPTGGIIYDRRAIAEAYKVGKGSITCRGVAEIKEGEKSRQFQIIISEIPYQVNKAELVIKIASLVQEKKIEGIRDVRDESDRKGMRVVVELKTDAVPQKILNQLYEYTDLQKDFHLNMLALVNGIEPQVLSLKDILSYYIKHREEVVRRRAEFDLKKAEERAHILEGLSHALANIDKIIAAIKKSADKEEAHAVLMKNFKLSDKQATAILEMRLQTLASLERQKIEDELKEKLKLIEDLKLLLKSSKKIRTVVKDELLDVRKRFGDERKTRVMVHSLKEFNEEDLIPNEETVITFSKSGYIKRMVPATFKVQKRGGKGLIGSDVGEEDFLTHLLSASTHDYILFFTDRGRVFQTRVYEIPAASRISKGKSIHNFLEIPTEENISAIVTYGVDEKGKENRYLVMVTKDGMIKKASLEDFRNVRRTGIIAINLKKGDLLRGVKLSVSGIQVIVTTSLGQAIRFKESDLRAMGRTAAGVRAIRLKNKDEISSLGIIDKDTKGAKLLVVTANGFAKQTSLSQYKTQRRGGSGIKTSKITSKTGSIIGAQIVAEETELLALSARGQVIKMPLPSIRQAGRATQGVRVMRLNAGDKLIGVVAF